MLRSEIHESRLASQTIASWDPLAEWLGAVDRLRRVGFGSAGAVSGIAVGQSSGSKE